MPCVPLIGLLVFVYHQGLCRLSSAAGLATEKAQQENRIDSCGGDVSLSQWCKI